jgi:hypothetical protein
VKPIEQVCVLLVLPFPIKGKKESHNACMELWRTSTTVASSHDLLRPQPPPDFFVCVPPSRQFVLDICLHILFFSHWCG